MNKGIFLIGSRSR